MSSQAAVLLHGSSAAIMAYGFNSLSSLQMDTWVNKQRGGHFQFLTVHGLCAAWLTMMMSLIADLFPSSIAIKKFKRVLLMTAMPLAVIIALIYWTLILFYPSLILLTDPLSSTPEALVWTPLPIDLALHAVPGLALFIDFILLESKFSKNEARYGAPLVVFLSTVAYSSWAEYCATFNGSFPYPFLTENPFNIRLVIYAAVMTLALASFWIVNALHPQKA
ncbi:hypothetical protein PILCRDRAFT_821982 [Piloderma croceum F 1598]|uniref:FAR-17a/AIG1-like protein n=1 Tax=Piloderma croceum (strain F 1598) TaxID=765440 RepID=A0A0C3F7V7_PILCF|nr:hypothetical protein PILCRDRAFT_821982 [Piloderma croceum F 1598]